MTTTPSETLRDRICRLRLEREERKSANRRPRNQSPSTAERAEILKKTDGNCHICGGTIVGDWQADHVKAHSGGGEHSLDNYLPAHPICNNYRWDYLEEEFQLILKLGVWARTQIEKNTKVGQEIGAGFAKHEEHRMSRRKHGPDSVR